MAKLTGDEAKAIGAALRDAEDGNMLVGSFAADLAGESYPFSKAMSLVAFQGHSDEALGRRFSEWCEAAQAKGGGGHE
jgi:hypothetical protein